MPNKNDKIAEKKPAAEPKKSLSEKDYEKKVIELSQSGLTAEKIGETLRNSNIHPSEYSRKISLILKEKNLYISPEQKNVENKLKKIVAHTEKNKQDKRAKREKDRVFSQLRRITAYQERKK